MTRASRAAGFTLLEVMIGLALLGFGLVVLIKSTTSSITGAKRAQMMGVVTDLSRAKMYDIEEKLLKEGFTETDQSEEGKTFDEEGWPEIKYSYKIEPVELPSFDQLQAMAQGQGSAAAAKERGSAGRGGSGSGDDEPSGSFEDSALGGVISMLGGGFAGGSTQSKDIDSKAGASFIQGYYQLVQEALKASIRKVTLTVKYDVLGEENELVTVAFFTEPSGLTKGTFGMAGALPDEAAGSGSGSGSKNPTTPPKQGPPK
ncbi:MAG TPA: type II secretion system protein [Kofleriaceae bacterium]|nr:type II secretion system protein [Kofleriaceae bacterium]